MADLITAQKKRVTKAKKRLHDLQEKIAPYVKTRKYKRISTRGRWRSASDTQTRVDNNDSRKIVDKC